MTTATNDTRPEATSVGRPDWSQIAEQVLNLEYVCYTHGANADVLQGLMRARAGLVRMANSRKDGGKGGGS